LPLLWIAASTMPEEEAQILTAFTELRLRYPGLKILIAPRHPNRFDAVEQLIRTMGFSCARRTRMQRGTDVILLDTIGELASAFKYASVVFMGGTLVARGGHNILEPAAFAKPIVFGPHMENFREIRSLFLEAGAAVEVRDAGELVTAIDRLLADIPAATALGERARRVVEQNTGATERVLAYLR